MKRHHNEISHDDHNINVQTLHNDNDKNNDAKKIKISNGSSSNDDAIPVVANFCDDIVYCIVSFMDFVTRVRCSILSKQWMNTPNPFKTVTLDFGRKGVNLELVAKCSYLQKIETLKLAGEFENGDKLLGCVHLGNLKALDLSQVLTFRKIKIYTCRTPDIEAHENGHYVLDCLLPSFYNSNKVQTGLWRFDFPFNCEDDGSYPALANLTSLNLGTHGLDSRSINRILQHTRALETLSVEGTHIDSRLFSFLRHNPYMHNITDLNLSVKVSKDAITDCDLEFITSDQCMPNLTSLDMSGQRWSQSAISKISNIKVQTLKKLRLANCYFSAVAVERFANNTCLSTLEYLNLSGNNLDDCAVEHLVNSNVLTNLTVLDIFDNEIKIRGGFLLTNMKSLKKIDLSRNAMDCIVSRKVKDAFELHDLESLRQR